MKARVSRMVALTAILCLSIASTALAAADPTTGIDWKVDVADKVLEAAKPALLAGLGIVVVMIAVGLGRRFFAKVGGGR